MTCQWQTEAYGCELTKSDNFREECNFIDKEKECPDDKKRETKQ